MFSKQMAANRHFARCGLKAVPRGFVCPRRGCLDCFTSASILDQHAALRHAADDDDDRARAEMSSTSSGDDDGDGRSGHAGASDDHTPRSGSASEDFSSASSTPRGDDDAEDVTQTESGAPRVDYDADGLLRTLAATVNSNRCAPDPNDANTWSTVDRERGGRLFRSSKAECR
jgi:hypothetical protein